jgi:hypothetical protein
MRVLVLFDGSRMYLQPGLVRICDAMKQNAESGAREGSLSEMGERLTVD